MDTIGLIFSILAVIMFVMFWSLLMTLFLIKFPDFCMIALAVAGWFFIINRLYEVAIKLFL